MPIYEYMCISCGYSFEQQQGMNDEPLSSCPECSSLIKRLITGGSGFIVKNGSQGNQCDCDFRTSGCGNDAICRGSEYSHCKS